MKRKTWLMIGAGIAGAFIAGKVIAKMHEEPKSIDDDNEYLNGDKELDSHSVKSGIHTPTIYEKSIKPAIDSILSFGGLVLLSPLYAIIALAIKIDDPGPVFFTQKRVGKDKHFFCLHKFRTMKMSTPHDVPTHQLKNPDQYITRVGRFLRKTSLDELPQIWDIYRQKMSIIGPRPALWNQADLVAERDRYGANDVLPGLTGWAQINGRDELEIVDKAKLDGEYVEKISLPFDVKCFVGTIKSVADGDGVVEGGTGTIHERDKELYGEDEYQIRRESSSFPLRSGVPEDDPETDWGFKKTFSIDTNRPVRVLITGAGSYIGTSFEEYVKQHYPNITVSSVDMIDGSWREGDWTGYDTVFHVAGIAHADVENVDEKTKELYYSVNTDLALEVARKAKESGIKQFIFMSSMIVYGGKEYVDEHTIPSPANFYGDSKWQADKGLRAMAENSTMKIAILRPPMIYGKGSKGNYPVLAKIAKLTPIFPKTNNKRSMLYIENLCEFVSQLAISGFGGVYVPQNGEYSDTSSLVQLISKAVGKKMYLSNVLSPAVAIANHVPGKIQKLAEKAFGSSWYDQKLSKYNGLDYQKVTLTESIERTEG